MTLPDSSHHVHLYGMSKDPQATPAVEAVKRHLGVGRAEAGSLIDACLAGKKITFTFDSEKLAREFSRDMYALGFLSEVTPRAG